MKQKRIMIISVMVAAALAIAFFSSGNDFKTNHQDPLPGSIAAAAAGDGMAEIKPQDMTAQKSASDEPLPISGQEGSKAGSDASSYPDGGDAASEQTKITDKDGGENAYQTNSDPEGKPAPVEPQDVSIGNAAFTCTISVSCAALHGHMDLLVQEKQDLVPKDGWILKPVAVEFKEGESVFNVLQRTLKQNRIHLEFVNTPIYNSAYIEGIHNLYEFDAGALSGWMYKVNGWFPNYGCSRYPLKDGDAVEWVYSCDLGRDVGGNNSAGE